MALALETLTLFPTPRCDAACAHCLFHSSPRSSGQLDLALARDLIAQAARDTGARRVVVSGGEPFLDFDGLLALAQATRAVGLAFGVVTNGSFAADAATAAARLRQLRDAGLASLTVSWDHFHAPFVDAGSVRTLLRLCREQAIPVLVSAIVTRERSLSDALAALGDDGFEVPAIQFRCLPVGRAVRAVPAAELLPPAPADRGRPCRADFGSIAVTHDGSVYPCVAVGGFTQGIRLGHAREGLAALLRRRDQALRWVLLAHRGPRAFLDHATADERRSLGIGDEDHDCVACHRLFASPLGGALAARAEARLRAEVEERFDLSTYHP